MPQILASHSLIHTAEGEFFRRVFWKASESLKIPVTGIQERELDPHVESVFGARAVLLKREIAGLGKLLGPPWTADQKHSALAALLFLADGQRTRRPLTKSASKPES